MWEYYKINWFIWSQFLFDDFCWNINVISYVISTITSNDREFISDILEDMHSLALKLLTAQAKLGIEYIFHKKKGHNWLFTRAI